MPFTGDNHDLTAGAIVANGTQSDAVSQHNTPLSDISDSLSALAARISTGAAESDVVQVQTRTELKAINADVKTGALLRGTGGDDGRAGLFHFVSGDKTAEVAADPGEGVWVAQTPSLGAWKRTETRKVSPKQFGATRLNPSSYDPDNPSATSSKVAIQRCWDWAAANKATVVMDDVYDGGNELFFSNDAHIFWEQGAFTYQTGHSTYGGFILARRPGDTGNRHRSNVYFENAQVDGALSLAPRYQTLQTVTSATVFTLDSSAPATDGALVGLFCLFLDGTAGINGLSIGFVSAYVGATRQVTLAVASNITPLPGTTAVFGYNDLGIGFGAYNSAIDKFHIRNYPFQQHIPFVNGAKAINTEQGCYGVYISNGLIQNCGFGIYTQGISWESIGNPDWLREYPSSGTAVINTLTANSLRLPTGASAVNDQFTGRVCYFYPTGDLNFKATYRRTIKSYIGATREVIFDFKIPADVTTAWTVVIGHSKRNAQIITNNVRVQNTGVVIAALGGEPFCDPEPFDNLSIISNVVAENCGYAPYRVVGTSQQKAGLIHLTGTANCIISDVNMYNDTFFPSLDPGWTGLASSQVGFGLSGNVQSIIHGCGRNTRLKNIHYHGDCDSMVNLARGRSIGRDQKPTGALRFNIDGLHHYGTCTHVFSTGDNAPNNADLTGLWENIMPGTVTTGFTDGSGIDYTGIEIELVDPLTNRSIRGTMQDINRYTSFSTPGAMIGNQNVVGQATASLQFRSYEVTMADDTVQLFPAPSFFDTNQELGSMVVGCNRFGASCFIDFRAGATTVYMYKMSPSNVLTDNVTVQAAGGILTGTTGTDGRLNVSVHTNKYIYVENRTGSSQTVSLTFLR
jgi:hypothetical protein